MKKISASLILALSLFALPSCNEKLNIAAPYKNITVVYGMLNRGDTAHYIRIQKAFMDENQSAVTMAKESDSSFYRSLNVVVKEINSAGTVVATIPLNRVNIEQEGYQKEPGTFFNSPSYAYKFKYQLDTTHQYRVVITNTETGNVDSAVTPIITNVGPNIATFGVIEWQRNEINFARVFRENGSLDESAFTIVVPPNTGAYELILRFNWTDSNLATKVGTRKSAEFNLYTQKLGRFTPSTIISNRFDVSTFNKDLYDFLATAIGSTTDLNQVRYMDSCDMFLYVAGTEFQKYKELNTNKGGITADEIRPIYTNIKGKDVIGLFSTKAYIKKLNLGIGAVTQDSLKTNSITRALNLRF